MADIVADTRAEQPSDERGKLTLPVPPARPVRAMQAGPGEFTAMAVVWGAFGLYALRQGFADDRSPLVIVGATAFAVMFVGVVWPILALRRVAIEVHTPLDAVVGARVAIDIVVSGHAHDVQLRVLDPPTPWLRAELPASGTIVQRPTHRGVYRRVRVEVKTNAPLAVFTRRRVLVAMLPSPLYVAPRGIRSAIELSRLTSAPHGPVPAALSYAAADAVRSVRPYVSGDTTRHIHWPSSARRGEIVVRDFDPPALVGLAIVVDLRGGSRAAVEAAAARAQGIAELVLAEGAACCLLTFDGAARTTFVACSRDVGRVLAAAVPGAPPEPPPGWPIEVVCP